MHTMKQPEYGLQRQRGVVLLISLIILVALTLASIALVRSIDTTNVIVGNLAFQQAATRAAERGLEAAICLVLEKGLDINGLRSDHQTLGYSASLPPPGDDPANSKDWDSYWRTKIDPTPRALPFVAANESSDCKSAAMVASGGKLLLTAQKVKYEFGGGGWACTLSTDDTGNTVAFTVQRMCKEAGNPALSGCVSAPLKEAPGVSLAVGKLPMSQMRQYYYRVTARVAGPRNTVSFVQTVVTR